MMKKAKKIFITGGTGHLGANLILKLIKSDCNLKILYRKNSSHPFLKNKKFEKCYGDLLDIDSLNKALHGCDTIIHAAAFISYKKSDYKNLYNVNYIGTKNLLKSALINKVKNFIFISTTAAVGYTNNPYNPLDEQSKFLKKYSKIGYMFTKHLAEQEVIKYKNRMNVIILNPSTIIGQGDNHNNTREIFLTIKDQKIKIAPPGGNSFVAVDDVVQAILSVLQNNIESGERFIINSYNITVLEYFKLIASLYNLPPIKSIIPRFLFYLLYPLTILVEKISTFFGKSPPITSELIKISFAYRYFDSTKARRELGWIPKKDLKTAVKEAKKYYEQNY